MRIKGYLSEGFCNTEISSHRKSKNGLIEKFISSGKIAKHKQKVGILQKSS